jgi:serine/threonine protein kinase
LYLARIFSVVKCFGVRFRAYYQLFYGWAPSLARKHKTSPIILSGMNTIIGRRGQKSINILDFSDMWSVGVVCYVLLSGLSPFMGDSDVETFANISGIAYDFDDEVKSNFSSSSPTAPRRSARRHAA